MNFGSRLVTAVGLAGMALLWHCGSSDDAGGAGSGGFGGSLVDGGSFGGSSGAGGGGGSGAAADAAPPPPEQELEGSFLSPVATGRYVWTANPESGRVALVDAFTLEVRVVEAGFGPTYLAAVSEPGDADANVAIVLNVYSDDATLFRVVGEEIAIDTLEVHQGANAWAISPGGKWAIAWTDAKVEKNPDPTEGFQDVTVISLEAGKETATRLTVGYRPTKIAFDAAETRAFAVTEPGISVLSLEEPGPSILDLIEVTDDPLENPASRDVLFTPDGSLALVRRDGSADVGLVDLATGQRSVLTLSGAVTDLDLTEDGSLAVAVVRDLSEVALLPLPAVAMDPSAIETTTIADEFFGSVALSADASRALLYTNAVPNDHVTVLELAPGPDYLSHRTVTVKTPVQAVFPAANALHAITLQAPGAGSSKAGAFSVVPMAAQISPKIVGTDAPPTSVSIAPPPGDRAVVTVRDDIKQVFGAYLIRLSNLQVDAVPLASPPLATGVVPAASKGYIAQEHPEGRITFVDLVDGSVRTLTGFELGAKIVD